MVVNRTTAGGYEVARGVVGWWRTALSWTDRTERKRKENAHGKERGKRPAVACSDAGPGDGIYTSRRER